jgi:hypothetical protein
MQFALLEPDAVLVGGGDGEGRVVDVPQPGLLDPALLDPEEVAHLTAVGGAADDVLHDDVGVRALRQLPAALLQFGQELGGQVLHHGGRSPSVGS